MRHLTITLMLGLVAAGLGAQTQESEREPEPAQSRGPVVERSASGVVMIRSSSAATQAARAEAAKAAEEAKKAAAESAESAEPAAESAAGANLAKPSARNVESYRYGPGGTKIRVAGQVSERSAASSSERVETIRGANGREVPYLSQREQTVSKTANGSVVERRVQRYDTDGRPTRQALVREEERKLADGTVERITTVYEEDLNGRMRAAERNVAREKTSGNVTRLVETTERAAPSGGFQTVEQKESLETRNGENAATVETTVKRPSVNGRLTEWARERSVMQKSGSTSTTETEVWERSTASGEVSLSQRVVGKLEERGDGSASESVQVYGYGGEGGARDANASSGPRLQQSVQREVAVSANGEKVETVTTRSRGIANSSEMGQREVVQKVVRPSADGESVETQVFEQGVNGRMRATQVTVEAVKK